MIKDWQPESLMDLLIGQCSDLEALLGLARREAVATEGQDFSELVAVAHDRATLGERLESYHRQISELRATMGRSIEHLFENPIAQETVRLAVEIQALDHRTKEMLISQRSETSNAIATLEHGRRNFVAYLSGDARASGFRCDWRA